MTPPELESNTDALTTLSSRLWRLREVLEHLLFKIFETRLVLQSAETKWFAKASRELDSALQELRHVEVLRAVESVTVADQLGLTPEVTLRDLADAVRPPWDSILHEHREVLRSLAADLDRAAATPPPPAPPSAGEAAADDLAGVVDANAVRAFLVETLANAPQTSLAGFLA
jgi:hypothetical protein